MLWLMWQHDLQGVMGEAQVSGEGRFVLIRW